MYKFISPALLFLAACATPLEQCISNATQDLRVLNGLITTTQGNIQRGYAIVVQEYFVTEQQVCGELNGEAVYCDVPVVQNREVASAIDLNVERAKLVSMRAKQRELSAQAEAGITRCRAENPEV
ncbi:MAG: hypothetical protein ACC619_06080 [Paracoccaceae bacterium]